MSVLGRKGDTGVHSSKGTTAVLVGVAAFVGLASTQVGFGELRAALAGVDARVLAVVAGAAMVALLLRGFALWVILDILGHRTPPGRVLPAYVAMVAVSTVVPGGQAGGAPINGYLVSRSSGADYEDGIAAVAGIAALSNAAVAVFGLLGAGYLLATAAGKESAVTLALVGAAVVGLAALALVGVWRVRERAGALAATAITSAGRVAAVIPGLSSPERDAADRRVSRLGNALARLRGGTPRQLVALAVLSGLAHALTIAALWVSFAAVGHFIPIAVVMAAIPAGVATAIVPTPGGFGSVEIALAGLLAAGTSAPAPIASAAVLVYQSATTVPGLVVGGGILAVMLSIGLADGGRLGSLWRNR